jgi:general secretion pathway protein J
MNLAFKSPPPPFSKGRGSRSGFTLLELLVAMAIFAFIGIMAYGGLAAIMKNAEGSRGAREQLATMQRGLRVLDDDFSLVVNRAVRDGLGSPHLALMTGRDGTTLLELTRTARVREGFAPSPFSRIRYRLEGGALLRDEWNPPDAAQLEPDQVMTLWSNVAQVRLTFLKNGQESLTWPPSDAENMSLPQAVSVQLILNDGREITQVTLLPDVGAGDAMAAAASAPAAASTQTNTVETQPNTETPSNNVVDQDRQ